MEKYYRVGFEEIREYVPAEKNGLYEFYVRDKDVDVPIRFLTKDVLCFTAHVVQEGKKFVNYVCTENDSCGLCKKGIKTQEKCAFLVLDGSSYTDKKGNSHTDTVKIFIRGASDAVTLRALNKRYGLTTIPFLIMKNSSGQYSFSKETELLELEEFKDKNPEFWSKGEPPTLEAYVRSKLSDTHKDMPFIEIVASYFKTYEETHSTSVTM